MNSRARKAQKRKRAKKMIAWREKKDRKIWDLVSAFWIGSDAIRIVIAGLPER